MYGAFVSRIPWFQAGERSTFRGFSIRRAHGCAATARVWLPSCECVVDDEDVDGTVAAVRRQRREAALQVVAGVVVDDDNGQVGVGRIRRSGISGARPAHVCGVWATSTMPVMMKNTPAHRSGGICLLQHEPVGEHDEQVAEGRERVRERQ